MNVIVEQNCGDICLSTQMCDSESEMRTRLKSFEKSVILADEDGSPRDFLLVKVRRTGEKWNTSCGLCCGSPINPQIVSHGKEYMRWVLLDKIVFLVDMKNAKIVSQTRLPAFFHDAISLENDGIVAVHEIGAAAINPKGETMWEIAGHDILAEYRIEKGQIVCRFEDGHEISHKLQQDKIV